MSMSDVSRSERVLNAIGSRIGLTECGRDWLIAACDPYHDKPLNICGYPDVNEAASVTQVVKLSAQISAPAGVSTNWDCHFHQLPWLAGVTSGGPTQLKAVQDNTTFLAIQNDAPSGSAWSGLIVDSVTAGSPTFYYANTTITTPFATQLFPYLTGEYRVIAMGFEVINTTSELNVQGLVTTYRYPMQDLDSASTIPALALNQGSGPSSNTIGFPSVLNTTAPPSTAGQALLLADSRQWKAKDGCYVVSTLNSDEIPTGPNNVMLKLAMNQQDPIALAGFQAITSPAASTPINIPPTTPTNSIAFLLSPNTDLTKFNHSGAYFQGLSNSTTLQVNVIYIVERFPTFLETDLVVLAKHSCRYDAAALELYSEVIRQMPVGVPQKMNGLGEWFSDAVSAASDFISPVLSAIPHPMAQGASAALKGVAGVTKKIMGSEVAPGKVYQANPMASSKPKPKTKAVAKSKPKAKAKGGKGK